nr:cytochrome c [Rhodoalgimonas zhirmunskyi]
MGGAALPREMTSTFMAGVADGAAIVTPRLPATLSEAAQSGKQVFDAKCAVCHGTDAAGKKGNGPPLVHKIYEPSHHGDYAVQLAVVQGVRAHHWPFGDMAPVPGVTTAQVEQIVAYLREMQRANGIR